MSATSVLDASVVAGQGPSAPCTSAEPIPSRCGAVMAGRVSPRSSRVDSLPRTCCSEACTHSIGSVDRRARVAHLIRDDEVAFRRRVGSKGRNFCGVSPAFKLVLLARKCRNDDRHLQSRGAGTFHSRNLLWMYVKERGEGTTFATNWTLYG